MTVLHMVGATCLALFMGISCVSNPAHAAAIDVTQIDFEYDSSAWTLD
ncbi:MAG: hypothetical protein HC938_00270 [Nitrospira sp.]|nr:hypothetical protein [Nitrospira sp.]